MFYDGQRLIERKCRVAAKRFPVLANARVRTASMNVAVYRSVIVTVIVMFYDDSAIVGYQTIREIRLGILSPLLPLGQLYFSPE